MISGICTHEKLTKHGKDRHGQQRWKCQRCGATITKPDHERPLGDMRIDFSKALMVLKMVLEGMSLRACERITGVKVDTICDLVLLAGEKCDGLLERTVTGVESKFIEMDEIWAFVGCKDKYAKLNHRGEDKGDAWTWFAIDADTKLILSHRTGKRDEPTCRAFLTRLDNAVVGHVQVTSDGLAAYTHAVPFHMGSRVDFAQLIKSYKSSQAETRYSPATISGIEKVPRFGNPIEARISTSYSERFNRTVRMHNRRLTRLTDAHSKSLEHHTAMMSLFTAFYNFCRKHETAGQPKDKDASVPMMTPAMAAGLAGHVWTIRELLEKASG